MIEISLFDVACRAANAAFTFYMMMILLRWLAPYLQLDMDSPRFQWISRLTDPLIRAMRKIAVEKFLLPRLGIIDYGPIFALFVLWVARAIVVAILARAAVGG